MESRTALAFNVLDAGLSCLHMHVIVPFLSCFYVKMCAQGVTHHKIEVIVVRRNDIVFAHLYSSVRSKRQLKLMHQRPRVRQIVGEMLCHKNSSWFPLPMKVSVLHWVTNWNKWNLSSYCWVKRNAVKLGSTGLIRSISQHPVWGLMYEPCHQ